MNAIQHAQTLDDVLRLFTGWQGTVFLFMCFLALALVIASAMLTGPITVRLQPDDQELEQERRASLDAAVNSSIPKYMNPFAEDHRPHIAAIARPMEPAVHQQPPVPASLDSLR